VTVSILTGDCRDLLQAMPDASVHCCVTSPPYFNLRDYGVDGQMGLEKTPDHYIAEMVAVFAEVRRVLRDDGTLWLNIGDSYGPGKNKLLIPARLAIALQADGWILRQDNVWFKKRPMPESVSDRSTCAHEFVFHFAKSASYYYDRDAVRTPLAESSIGRLAQNVSAQSGSDRANGGAKTNGKMKAVGGDKQRGHTRRHAGFNSRWDAMSKAEQMANGANLKSVWHLAPPNFADAHFATMPEDLAEICIKAGCPAGGTVLDLFGGAGTTGLVADRLQRHAILIELNPEYAALARGRIDTDRGALLCAMDAAA
jgi:DNA modification methylase